MVQFSGSEPIWMQWIPNLRILEILPKIYGFICLPRTFRTLNTVSQNTPVFSDYKRLGSTAANEALLWGQKKRQVNLSELVHLRQIIKMIYKILVNPSHLFTQQMVIKDDTKPMFP